MEENKENYFRGTSLEVHWLRLQAPSARGLGSVSGQGTKSCRLRFPHATGGSLCSQINTFFFFNSFKKDYFDLAQMNIF